MKIIFTIIILLTFIFVYFGCKKDNPVENNDPIPSEPKVILHLPFNGNSYDESGNGNNASTIDATLTSDRNGNNNSAYYFDGTNDFISIPSSSSLESTNNGITISVWIYINEWYNNKWAPIFAKSNNSGYGMYGFQILNFSNRKQFEVQLKGNFISADYVFQKNQWYHVAFTWDGTNCKYFINGSKFYERQWSGTIGADSRPLLIGKDTPEITEYLNGKLDDIRIYDKAISETQVDSLFRLNN